MYMKKRFIHFATIYLFLNFLSSFSARSDDISNLFDLSLEDLMKVQVTIASSKPELIRETPAIVSYINVSEMRSMGIHSIEDMLNMLPSFTMQQSFVGSGPLMIRGVTEPYNQKVLFLLDGVPYFQPTHSDIALRGISLAIVDHIEVIRGPGAVIYGTNAIRGFDDGNTKWRY